MESKDKAELYNKFKEALNIKDMRVSGNPFIVDCCKIAGSEVESFRSRVIEELEGMKDRFPASMLTEYDSGRNKGIDLAIERIKKLK